MQALKHRIEYAGLWLMVRFACVLSGGGRRRVGAFLGRLMRRLVPQLRRTARDNIANAYPDWDEKRVDELLRANFEHVGRLALEVLASARIDPETIRKQVRVEGFEVYEAAAARGKGVFLLVSHLGNWEWGGYAMIASGLRLHAIWRRMTNVLVERKITEIRERCGAKLIPHRDAVRPVLRALKAGGTVAFLLDQRARGKEWVPSRFFGKPVATSQGLALLALRTGAPVVYSECVWEDGGYVARFGPLVEPPEIADRDEAIRAFTRRFDEVIEAGVRRHPEQWFWFHKRWKLPNGFPQEMPS